DRRPVIAAEVVDLAVERRWVVYLEEELEDVAQRGLLRVEDDLRRFGVCAGLSSVRLRMSPSDQPTRVEITPRRLRSSSCIPQKQPPARTTPPVPAGMARLRRRPGPSRS